MSDAVTAARRWRGMAPEERDAQRRERLLDAALELFGTQGYAATSIEELCATGGVATRSLYELFGSREHVLLAVYDGIVDGLADGVYAALAGAPVEDAVRAAVRAYVEPLVRDERKGRIVQLEVVGVTAEIEAHRREVIRSFAAGIDDVLGRWAADGLVRTQAGGLLTLVIVGGVSEALVDHLVTPKRRRRSVRSLVDEVTRTWLLVIQPA